MYSKDELKNLKLEFWESFAAYCEVQPYLRGRKKIWTLPAARALRRRFSSRSRG